jgi:hypothetical protein
MNGRIGDNVFGKLTCKGSSTVDYFLSHIFSDISVITPVIIFYHIVYSYATAFEE